MNGHGDPTPEECTNFARNLERVCGFASGRLHISLKRTPELPGVLAAVSSDPELNETEFARMAAALNGKELPTA